MKDGEVHVKVSVLLQKVSDVLGRETQIHASVGRVEWVSGRIKKVEYLLGYMEIRVLGPGRDPAVEEQGAIVEVVVIVVVGGYAICSDGIGSRFLFGYDRFLSNIRREGITGAGILRTRLEHRRPVKVRRLIGVLSCKHGKTILVARHVIARGSKLRVDVWVHAVRNVAIVRLIETASARGCTHSRAGDASAIAVVRIL